MTFGVERLFKKLHHTARSALGAGALLLVPFTLSGCTHDEEGAAVSATMNPDGYALFSVDNDRQQRLDVTVTVTDAEPGATYVLLYSEGSPSNVGWFRFDAGSTSRCGGDPGPHCEVPGYGYLVDVATVAPGMGSVTLRDGRCGCDAKDYTEGWSGHWAIMRIERPNRANPLSFDVRAKKLKDYATEPGIHQLQ